MTRKSKRELERAVEDLDDGTGPDFDPSPGLTDAEMAAVRAIESYRIHNRLPEPQYTPDGRILYSRAVLEEALANIDDDLERAFRDRWMPGAVR